MPLFILNLIFVKAKNRLYVRLQLNFRITISEDRGYACTHDERFRGFRYFSANENVSELRFHILFLRKNLFVSNLVPVSF